MATERSSASPVLAAVIGAVLGAAVTAGGFLAFQGGDTENPPRSFDETPAPDETTGEAPDVLPEVDSDLGLDYVGGGFVINVDADAAYCLADRDVTIFQKVKKKKPGHKAKIKNRRVGAAGPTDESGQSILKKKHQSGKFFGVLSEEPSGRYGDLSICLGDTSEIETVR